MHTRPHHDSLVARRHYKRAAATARTRRPDAAHRVRFRPVASARERLVLTGLVALNAVTALVFIGWLVQPEHRPGYVGHSPVGLLWTAWLGFVLVGAVEVIRVVQNIAIWVYAFNAKDPVP